MLSLTTVVLCLIDLIHFLVVMNLVGNVSFVVFMVTVVSTTAKQWVGTTSPMTSLKQDSHILMLLNQL